MRTRQRREEEKAQRREALIDAAEKVFRKTGYERATMDDVARHARVSRALVYLYFRNKNELQLAVCLRGLLVLRQRFEAAAGSAVRGIDQVAAIGRAYFDFAEQQPVYFDALARFEIQQFAPDDGSELQRSTFEAGMAVHGVTISALQCGIADGSVRSDIDALLTSISLWAFTHGMIQLAQNKGGMLEEMQIGVARFIDYAFGLGLHAVQNTSKTGRRR